MSQSAMTEVVGHKIVLQRLPFGAPADEVAAVMGRDGGLILTGVLTRSQVDAVNRELDPGMGALPQGNFSDGDQNSLGDFMGHRTKRLTHCVRYSPTLREIFDSEVIAGYLAATVRGDIGSHSMFSSHCIEIYPGEKAQELHRDGGGLNEALGLNRPGGVNVLVNMLLALTEVTEEMGATRVIPGSHLWDDFSTKGSHAQTIPATMEPGDILFINSKILHGGGANVTTDRRRRVLSTGFSLGFFMGEEAWPFAIPLEEARTYPKRIQSYLGFRSVSYRGEQPGFLWRVDARPLEEHFAL